MKSFLFLVVSLAVIFIAAPVSNAGPLVFVAFLSGPNESPPNGSTATGFATVVIDSVAHTMQVQVTFSGLTTGNTASHIHAATATPFTGIAGVATTTPTFTGFPTGTTSGTYNHIFDMTLSSSYNSAFVTANGGTPLSAEAALFSAIMDGRAYLNIHTSTFTGGEIRGFLVATPEPASMVLLGTGLVGVAYRVKRRRGRRDP